MMIVIFHKTITLQILGKKNTRAIVRVTLQFADWFRNSERESRGSLFMADNAGCCVSGDEVRREIAARAWCECVVRNSGNILAVATWAPGTYALGSCQTEVCAYTNALSVLTVHERLYIRQLHI